LEQAVVGARTVVRPRLDRVQFVLRAWQWRLDPGVRREAEETAAEVRDGTAWSSATRLADVREALDEEGRGQGL
jgi:hypothetical protein